MTLNYIIRIEKNGRETRQHFVAHLAEILTVKKKKKEILTISQ